MRFSRLITLGFGGLAVGLSGCGRGATPSTRISENPALGLPTTRAASPDSVPYIPPTPRQQMEAVYGVKGLAVLHRPVSAELLSLAETWPNPPAATSPGDRVGDRLILARKAMTDAGSVAAIARVLRAEKSYDFSDPGPYDTALGTIAIRFTGEAGRGLCVLYNPALHTVGVLESAPQAPPEARNMEDYGLLLLPGRPELVRLLKTP